MAWPWELGCPWGAGCPRATAVRPPGGGGCGRSCFASHPAVLPQPWHCPESNKEKRRTKKREGEEKVLEGNAEVMKV